MTKAGKLKQKLLRGSGFKWAELSTLLENMGYMAVEGRGSRVKFVRDDKIISLHRPHPNPELKRYQIRYVIDHLKVEGEL